MKLSLQWYQNCCVCKKIFFTPTTSLRQPLTITEHVLGRWRYFRPCRTTMCWKNKMSDSQNIYPPYHYTYRKFNWNMISWKHKNKKISISTFLKSPLLSHDAYIVNSISKKSFLFFIQKMFYMEISCIFMRFIYMRFHVFFYYFLKKKVKFYKMCQLHKNV